MIRIYSNLSELALVAALELCQKGPMPNLPRPVNHSHPNLDKLIAELEMVENPGRNHEFVLSILRGAREEIPQRKNRGGPTPRKLIEGIYTCILIARNKARTRTELSLQPPSQKVGWIYPKG